MTTYKVLSAFAIAITSMTLLTNTVLANKRIENHGFAIKVIEDCQIIMEIPLNAEQIKTYLALKKEEEKMAKLEIPISAIEEKIEVYTSQIERLSQQAFTHTAQSFHINKAALAEQELVIEKLDKLMALHQADFDALGTQGKRIGAIADEFSEAIMPSLANIEYKQITISHQDETFSSKACNSERDVTIL